MDSRLWRSLSPPILPLGRVSPATPKPLQWGSLGLGFLLLTWEVRFFYHPGQITSSAFELHELGTLCVAWLLAAGGLLAAARRWPLRALSLGGAALAALATFAAVTAPGFALNPLWNHWPVGDQPIWNALLWIYGVPALLLVLVARMMKGSGGKALSRVMHIASLLLALLLVTLQVRQYFHGNFLDGGEILSAEHYAYSISWILLGLALLVGRGVAAGSDAPFRFAGSHDVGRRQGLSHRHWLPGGVLPSTVLFRLGNQPVVPGLSLSAIRLPGNDGLIVSSSLKVVARLRVLPRRLEIRRFNRGFNLAGLLPVATSIVELCGSGEALETIVGIPDRWRAMDRSSARSGEMLRRRGPGEPGLAPTGSGRSP